MMNVFPSDGLSHEIVYLSLSDISTFSEHQLCQVARKFHRKIIFLRLNSDLSNDENVISIYYSQPNISSHIIALFGDIANLSEPYSFPGPSFLGHTLPCTMNSLKFTSSVSSGYEGEKFNNLCHKCFGISLRSDEAKCSDKDWEP